MDGSNTNGAARRRPRETHGRDFPQPLWRGEDDIAGKTILLHSEQGFGDSIQFCRYVPLVAARGARVVMEVEEPLCELMTGLAGTTQIIAKGDLLPDFDLQCPLPSLPLAFKTRLGTIPSSALSARAKAGAGTLGRVAGDPTLPEDRAGLGRQCETCQGSGAVDDGCAICCRCWTSTQSFVSLQKELRAGDAETLKRCNMLQSGHKLGDFSDTAALISQLDLVISVDTSVAHLAGALGKPVWILLTHAPDWRWLLDRDDSPWYPSARLFRQSETRDWSSVMMHVRDALREFTGVCAGFPASQRPSDRYSRQID